MLIIAQRFPWCKRIVPLEKPKGVIRMSEMIHPNPDQQKLQKKKKRKKVLRVILRTFLILLLIAALLLGGLFIYGKTRTGNTVTYQPYTASQGTISNALSFSGSLQLISNATYTADAASEVRTVYVAAGDQVKAGQKLIRLSNGQTVEAEFDGRVNQLMVSAGDKVTPGTQLIQVADFSRMKVVHPRG